MTSFLTSKLEILKYFYMEFFIYNMLRNFFLTSFRNLYKNTCIGNNVFYVDCQLCSI
jgi:hypothetical protein